MKYETPVGSFDEVDRKLRDISRDTRGRTLVWRGVTNARWGLHSSLYRRTLWKFMNNGEKPHQMRVISEGKKGAS
jgi:hypothetical protein